MVPQKTIKMSVYTTYTHLSYAANGTHVFMCCMVLCAFVECDRLLLNVRVNRKGHALSARIAIYPTVSRRAKRTRQCGANVNIHCQT